MKRIIWLAIGILIGTYFAVPIKDISKRVYDDAKVIATRMIREAKGAKR